ncbi:MAG: DNA recombination protein RmuC [Candidatus Tokpelaia sp. JSC189]|nr:MAG: DNA recombination protein RmuC [Candidatus Tokpelaia sp. JSC189]
MIDSHILSTSPLLPSGGYISLVALILGFIAIFSAGGLVLAIRLWRTTNHRTILDSQAAERARDVQMDMSILLQMQAKMQGRMQTIAELFGARQAELNKSIREKLDGMTTQLGQTINAQTKSTHENLCKLQERLAVIDSAQNNIQSLAGQVVELQSILSNKQTRGAFGQGRMEAIIADNLPSSAYAFQATLSNNMRPDCIVYMPNNAPSLIIDAKFPLEAWNTMRSETNPQARRQAEKQLRKDIETHVRDIAQKYLIAGETQDTAFLFVPSESIFATIHEEFENLVQKANRSRIIIVSPSLLMLSIQVVQAILKNTRMREQAHLIQAEVRKLIEDIKRLDERVRKLQGHFQQTEKDVNDILVSTSKLARHGAKIEALELSTTKESEMPKQRLGPE